MPKFSVIATEHNSVGYMRRMLGSIRRQTFRDFELIITCDRCNDNTAKVAREYSDKVLEVDFGRCGLSRNAALEIATGEYILFSDDDDWWLHDYAFELIDKEAQDNVDVVAFGFLARDFCGYEGLHTFLSHDDNISEDLRVWAAPWTKAWRREIIGDHRFPDVEHSDDLPFTREMIPLVQSIRTIYQPLYYYNYMRPGSIQDRLARGELK